MFRQFVKNQHIGFAASHARDQGPDCGLNSPRPAGRGVASWVGGLPTRSDPSL